MLVTCLTIRPPYSDLIAMGVKTGEFRNWKTDYRGLLYIHAAAKADSRALAQFYRDFPEAQVRYGELVCVVELKDIVESDEIEGYRYKWQVDLKQILKPGLKRSGKLMLWKTQI